VAPGDFPHNHVDYYFLWLARHTRKIPPAEPLRQRRGAQDESRAPTVVEASKVVESSTTMSGSSSFDQLKREAVNLERQLEDKISRYQQVGYLW
jgi:hypothetical protein